MTRRLFFTGKTQADRDLLLWYDRPEGSENPGDTQHFGSLDGEQLVIEKLRWKENTVTVTAENYGTFTAVKDGASPSAHSEALRDFLDARPIGGFWSVEVERRELKDGRWRFVVAIGNGKVLQRYEFRITEALANSWLAGARTGETLNDIVTENELVRTRSQKWDTIEKMAEYGVDILGGRLRR